jgi:hypothetical protein
VANSGDRRRTWSSIRLTAVRRGRVWATGIAGMRRKISRTELGTSPARGLSMRILSSLVVSAAVVVPLLSEACPQCGGHRSGYYSSRHYYTPAYTSGVSVGVGYSAPVYRPYRSYSYGGAHYYRSAGSATCPDAIEVDVQRELARRGYYQGAIDGVIGFGSRAAIQSFQSANGLCVTGQIDRAILRALGL